MNTYSKGGATTGIIIIILILLLAGFGFYKMTKSQIAKNKAEREATPETVTIEN